MTINTKNLCLKPLKFSK